MYGDDVRNAAAAVLSRTPVLPSHIPQIVDYAIARPTDRSNFEGRGFNYSPLTAQEGPPGPLQVFELTAEPHGKYGIKTLFGSYWRSEHWNKRVSQSPHCQGDERWKITPATLPTR